MYSTPEYHYKSYKNVKSRRLAVWKAPFRFCKEFCMETSMHGFNHIASSRRHWFERLLWAFVTGAAIWGAVEISLGQLQRYNENPTVVTLEKDFRTWNFSLPAITVCDQNRVKASMLPGVIQRFWNVTPEHDKYEYYSRFVTTVANSDLLRLEGYQEFRDDESLNVDLLQLVQEVAPEVNVKTSWSVDVEATWTPVMTEAGVCFSTNSLAIADIAVVPIDVNDTKMFPLVCKYASMSCFVILEVTANCSFWAHSPYDIMDITAPASRVILTLNRLTSISVTETRSGKGVAALAAGRRACRYTGEPLARGRQVFSTNTCRLTCRSKLAIKLCGCKPFYYFYEEGSVCTPAGMACLAAYADVLSSNAGARCACAQQCVDSIFREISTEDQIWAKGPFVHRGSIRYTVQAPRTRYTREIVFHFQDLVVSFGGAAGLFLGASFISFVEIFYFIIVRFLKICVVEDTAKMEASVKKTQPSIPYETRRMVELTSVLEHQRRFEPERPLEMYY